MLNELMDMGLRLSFIFLAFNFFVSSIVEAWASSMKWRSRALIQGIKDLLNDPNFDGLALGVYNHARIDPRDHGTAKTESDLRHAPAYIDPKQFGDALISVTKIAKDTPGEIKLAIDANVGDKQLNRLLNEIVDRTGADFEKIRDELADWFDDSMDRVSGAYKRKTQLWAFAVGLTMAIVFNLSPIDLGRAMWQQPMIERAIAPTVNQDLSEVVERVEQLGIPVGWNDARFKQLGSPEGLVMLAAWLTTALTTLFGAPLLFDVLQRVARLKGSGPSPAEKRSGTAAAT